MLANRTTWLQPGTLVPDNRRHDLPGGQPPLRRSPTFARAAEAEISSGAGERRRFPVSWPEPPSRPGRVETPRAPTGRDGSRRPLALVSSAAVENARRNSGTPPSAMARPMRWTCRKRGRLPDSCCGQALERRRVGVARWFQVRLCIRVEGGLKGGRLRQCGFVGNHTPQTGSSRTTRCGTTSHGRHQP